jgi:chromosome segregation ATPase
MQDNKNPHTFDDILQCKADILKALGRTKQADQSPPAPQVAQIQDTQQPVWLEDSSEVDAVVSKGTDKTAPGPVGETIRIVPFESPVKKNTVSEPMQDQQPRTPEAGQSRELPDENLIIIDDDEIDLSDLESLSDSAADKNTDNTPAEESAEALAVSQAEIQQLLHPASVPDEVTLVSEESPEDFNVDSQKHAAENVISSGTSDHTQTALAEQKQETERLLGRLQVLSETIEPLRAANEQLKQQVQEIQSTHQAAAEQSSRIQQELLKSLEEEKAANAAARDNLESIQLELQKITQARDFLGESFSSVSEQNQLLHAQLNTLTGEKNELAGRVELLLAETSQLKLQMESRPSEPQADTNSLNETIARLQDENKRLAGQVASAEIRLRELGADQKELHSALSQNQSLRQMLTETEAALSQEHVRIRELEGQIRRLSEEKETSLSELEQFKQTGQELQSQEAYLRCEIEKLQAVYTRSRQGADQEISDLNRRVQQVTGQMQQAEKNCEQHQKEAEQLKGLLQETLEEKQRLETDLAGVRQQADELNQRILEVEARYSETAQRLRDETAAGRERQEAMTAQLEELNQKLSLQQEHERQSAEYLSEIERLRAAEASLADELARLREQTEARKATYQEAVGLLQQEITRLRQHEAELLSRTAELEEALKSEQSQQHDTIDRLCDEKARLEQDRDAWVRQLDDLKQQSATAQAAYVQSMEESNQRQQLLQRELEEIRQQFDIQQQDSRAALEGMQLELAQRREREQSLLGKAAEVERTINSQLAAQKDAMERLQDELAASRQRQQAAVNALQEAERLFAGKESQYCQAIEQARSQTAGSERQYSELKSEYDRLRAQIARWKAELQQYDMTESPSTFAGEDRPVSKSADRRLEVILQPEEVSALMESPEWDDEPPVCDSVADTSVTEAPPSQDVPVEPSAEPAEMPAFSLADLILSEHRRKAAVRRQRVEPTARERSDSGIRQVVDQYIQPAPAAPAEAKACSRAGRMWEDDFLTPFQRELLQEIIRNDIHRLGDNAVQHVPKAAF